MDIQCSFQECTAPATAQGNTWCELHAAQILSAENARLERIAAYRAAKIVAYEKANKKYARRLEVFTRLHLLWLYRRLQKPSWWGRYQFFRQARTKYIYECLGKGTKPPFKCWRLPMLLQFWIEGTCNAVKECVMKSGSWGLDYETYEERRVRQNPGKFPNSEATVEKRKRR